MPHFHFDVHKLQDTKIQNTPHDRPSEGLSPAVSVSSRLAQKWKTLYNNCSTISLYLGSALDTELPQQQTAGLIPPLRRVSAQTDRFGGGNVMMWGTQKLYAPMMNFFAVTCCPFWISRENSFSRTMPGCIRHVLQWISYRMRTLICCHVHQDHQISTPLNIYETNWTDIYANVTHNCSMHCRKNGLGFHLPGFKAQ